MLKIWERILECFKILLPNEKTNIYRCNVDMDTISFLKKFGIVEILKCMFSNDTGCASFAVFLINLTRLWLLWYLEGPCHGALTIGPWPNDVEQTREPSGPMPFPPHHFKQVNYLGSIPLSLGPLNEVSTFTKVREISMASPIYLQILHSQIRLHWAWQLHNLRSGAWPSYLTQDQRKHVVWRLEQQVVKPFSLRGELHVHQ